MRKYFFVVLFFASLFLFSVKGVSAKQASIDFFFSPTCPHCAQEEKFLDDLQQKYPDIEIRRFSVFEKDNLNLLKSFYEKYNVPAAYQGMVPVTFTEEKYFVGFSDNIQKGIEECIIACKKEDVSQGDFTAINLEGDIALPVLGMVNIKDFSLPILSVVLGLLDGFNVCSLGALFLILGIVLGLKSRKKTLLFGGIFIIATAAVYGLLIFIWYQIFSFLVPYMKIMKILIGLLGIGGGIYFFREFLRFRKYGPTCGATAGQGIISKFSSKFQDSLKKSVNIVLLLLAVLLFAALITIIEFPCSAVVPVAYAGILARSNLPAFQYLFYISFYLLFYMLDEIIVFLIAFFTMKLWLSSSRVVVWITLLESIILFALGFYYIF